MLDRSSDMETAPELKLSPSEKWTLQKTAEGEYHLRDSIGSPSSI